VSVRFGGGADWCCGLVPLCAFPWQGAGYLVLTVGCPGDPRDDWPEDGTRIRTWTAVVSWS